MAHRNRGMMNVCHFKPLTCGGLSHGTDNIHGDWQGRGGGGDHCLSHLQTKAPVPLALTPVSEMGDNPVETGRPHPMFPGDCTGQAGRWEPGGEGNGLAGLQDEGHTDLPSCLPTQGPDVSSLSRGFHTPNLVTFPAGHRETGLALSGSWGREGPRLLAPLSVPLPAAAPLPGPSCCCGLRAQLSSCMHRPRAATPPR